MQHWPSSPLQPPEFGGSCQILGVAEDYLALETSRDQSHHAPELIRTKGEDQFGGMMLLVK